MVKIRYENINVMTFHPLGLISEKKTNYYWGGRVLSLLFSVYTVYMHVVPTGDDVHR